MTLLTPFQTSARWCRGIAAAPIAAMLISGTCLLAADPPSPPTGEGVLALVNGETIQEKRVGEETMLRYGADIVDGMVDRYLVLQACKEAGIHISNQDVQNEVIRVAGKFGLSPESYLRLLEEERGISHPSSTAAR